MRILLVDDEPQIIRALSINLRARGHTVHAAPTGAAALDLAARHPVDLIVLDLGLPDLDGVQVIEGLRGWTPVPIIVLSGRTGSADKVGALDAGADDYLTKPFHTEELLARLRALLRRSAGHAAPSLSIGGLRLDPRAARASVNGEPLRLTSLEYRLLHYLMMHQGRVISRTELVEHLYDQDFDRDSNTIEVFIGRVRKKIGADRIETVRGLGYRLTAPADELGSEAPKP